MDTNKKTGPSDAIDFDPAKSTVADDVRKARGKFAKIVQEAAADFYVETGFVVSSFTLRYLIKRDDRGEIAHMEPHAMDVEVHMPEDVI